MDNFAIDLDKVLDDFELDEDENESSNNYERLQLEFQRENILPSHRQEHLAAVAGLGISAAHGLHVNTDEQHPKLEAPAKEIIEQNMNNESPRVVDILPNVYQPDFINRNSLLNNVHGESAQVPDLNQERNFQQRIDLPNILSQNRSNDELMEADNAPVPGAFCALDVIPFSLNPHNDEIQQPDLLGMNQQLVEDVGNQQIIENPHVIPERRNSVQELLLPDIMSNNLDREADAREDNPHFPQVIDPEILENPPVSLFQELNDPAVVTENSLSSHHNDPAIVQESQSANRIPEVANVHQSAEQRCWSDTSSNTDCVSPRCLPDISADCISREDQLLRFDPNSIVATDEDLEAELEEEQARLQGAYESNQSNLQALVMCNLSAREISSNASNSSKSPDILGNIEGRLDQVLPVPEENLTTDNVSNQEIIVEQTPDISNNPLPTIENARSSPVAIVQSIPETDKSSDEAVEIISNVSTSSESSSSSSSLCTREEAVGFVASSEGIVEDVQVQDLPENSEEQSEEVEQVADAEVTESPVEAVSSEVAEVSSSSPEETLVPSENSSPPDPSIGAVRNTPGSLVTAIYDDRPRRPISNDGLEGAVGHQHLDSEEQLMSSIGMRAPFWIPDDEASNCQECGVKFTVIRRRHHCRGCGRVLCSPCCHFKAPLPYMDYKEARVCNTCLQLLNRASDDEDTDHYDTDRIGSAEGRPNPNPNNPMEYCSRIPPEQQVRLTGDTSSPPTVMVPVGVLKRENSVSGAGSGAPRSSKQVIFSDGIRPGGDLTESGGQVRPSSPFRRAGRSSKKTTQNIPEYTFDPGSEQCRIFEEKMTKEDGDPVVIALQKNLSVLVKKVKLDCCVGLEVWNVATRGLCNVGQEEIVVLLEVFPGEKMPPPHLFMFFHTVYQQANKGNLVTELGHSIFTEPEGFLGSKDHGGFLYIRPTFQCLQKLVLPPSPYIFAVLIQKWETPWAKVFPLRLMLRLGAEFRYYPCPIVSNRNRKPVYCEIGHTIMNLLVDFRNYAYTVPVIQGFLIHMEDKQTTLMIPKNRYEQVWKALNNSNDHVLALGSNFSPQADSHLVTVEDDDGHYTTQAINIHNKPRKMTGASFIVFNGALKSNSGLKAKSSIVEDGLMVQIPGEMMTNLREALRNIKDFDIPCGPSSVSEPDETISVRWGVEDKNFNIGIKSPVDNREMDGVPSVKIHSGTDYISNEHLIRWTEVFIIKGEASTGNSDINISRLADSLARAVCIALTPHLELLYGVGPNKIGVRSTVHQDDVGYEAGMSGSKLLPTCMNELDTELIPVIHRAAANITEEPIVLELLFHIMQQ